MVIDGNRSVIELTLASPEELFVGPAPGVRSLDRSGTATWDQIGAVLGEPGVDRLLRLVHANPQATVVRVRLDGDGLREQSADLGVVQGRLRTWLDCRLAVNAEQIRTIRRIGLRSTLLCLFLLGGALLLSWALRSERLMGEEAGPLRTLLAEALVIAGWVAMWRPLEMLLCDASRYRHENRLIALALAMRWEDVVEP